MDTKAHKCPTCRKTFKATKITQIFCSAKCRQAAYRKRKKPDVTPRRKEEQAALVLICEHCGGAFWAKRARARFCSTSCRSLYHRAMKTAILEVLVEVYKVPEEKAADLLETLPIDKLRHALASHGFSYSHTHRQWLQHS